MVDKIIAKIKEQDKRTLLITGFFILVIIVNLLGLA